MEHWVAASRAWPLAGPLLDTARILFGGQVDYFNLKGLDDVGMLNVLLASAAIPFAFPKREVNGRTYVDGGIDDNVPLKALGAAECRAVVVVHLGNGATWNRQDFPEVAVVEIRPELPIQTRSGPLGWMESIIDFSPERINELRARGYADAERVIPPIARLLASAHRQRNSLKLLQNSTRRLDEDPPLE
jgi:NTE family protein